MGDRPKGQYTTPWYPLFLQYNLEFLSGKTGYSARYLGEIAQGKRRANRQFRAFCVRALGKTEEELFGKEDAK